MKTNDEIVIVNGNKTIAEFMSKIYESELDAIWGQLQESGHRNPDLMDDPKNYKHYHSSWDWLMPVVTKCFENADLDNAYLTDIREALWDVPNIEAVWLAVVKFIAWYNAHPLHNGKRIIAYNEEHHQGLDDEQLRTIDESEIDDYLKWYYKK